MKKGSVLGPVPVDPDNGGSTVIHLLLGLSALSLVCIQTSDIYCSDVYSVESILSSTVFVSEFCLGYLIEQKKIKLCFDVFRLAE